MSELLKKIIEELKANGGILIIQTQPGGGLKIFPVNVADVEQN